MTLLQLKETGAKESGFDRGWWQMFQLLLARMNVKSTCQVRCKVVGEVSDAYLKATQKK